MSRFFLCLGLALTFASTAGLAFNRLIVRNTERSSSKPQGDKSWQ